MAILYHADWCVCAFERGKVGDVISSGCATTKIVLREKLLKAGKLCVVLRCWLWTGRSREPGDWQLEK